MFDIPSDDILIKPNGGDKIASGPQGLLFIKPVLGFNLFLHPGTALAFDDLHAVGNTVSGSDHQHQVDMVNLDVEF